MNLSQGVEYGLIAQDVENVMPHLVVTGEDGYKKVKYTAELEMRVIEAVKEQQVQIESLQKQIDTQQDEISKLTAAVEELKEQ